MRDRKTTLHARTLRQECTVAERALWERLRAHRFRGWKVRRQSGVAGYVVDFTYHAPKLVIELDGPVHDDPEQAAFDKRRDSEISAAGFAIVRIDERLMRERPGQALACIEYVGRRVLAGLPPYPEADDD